MEANPCLLLNLQSFERSFSETGDSEVRQNLGVLNGAGIPA